MTNTIIYTGVTSSNLTIGNGDKLIVMSGGVSSETTIQGGGSATLSAGGRLTDITISAGGSVSGPGAVWGDVADFGTFGGAVLGVAASGSSLQIPAYLDVDSGGVASNVTLRAGSVDVQSAGSALGDLISSGAVEIVEADGTVSGTRVLKGGFEQLFDGAVVEASTISSGAYLDLTEIVTSTQTFTISGAVSATTAISGATLLSGAAIVGFSDLVSSGGVLSVAAGAFISSVNVLSGGEITGGGALIADGFIDQGSASGLAVGQVGGSRGALFLQGAGASASDLLVDNGTVNVANGTTASGDVVSSGSTELVSSGGTDAGTSILNGGVEVLVAGGTAQSVTVSSGGVLEYQTTVSSGQTLIASGTVTATTTVSGVTLLSGAALGAYEDDVQSSGVLSLGSGALGVNLNVDAGGEIVGSGTLVGYNNYASGLVSGLALAASGGTPGYLHLDNGGTASAVSVGSDCVIFDFTGAANADVIGAAGSQLVFDGATALDTTVSGGGIEIISAGASATSDTISSGGVVSVLSGGFEQNGSALAGGRLVLAPGGIVSSAFVFPGGTLELQSLTITAGQTFAVSNTYADTTISGVTLADGSLVVDQTTVSGGVLSLAAGVVMSNVTVSSGGVLLGPGEVAGDAVLVDATLVSGIALGDDHGGAAQLQVLSGGFAISVAEAGAGDLIAVLSGGTAIDTVETGAQARLVVSVGALGSATTIRAGADAVVYGSAAATHISSGGIEYVKAGGTAAGIVVLAGGLEQIASGGTTSIANISSGGTVSVAGGARLRQATEAAGGVIVVNGGATWTGASTYTLKGSLSGKGDLYEEGPGTLVLSGGASAFAGEAIVSGGTIELASSSGLGAGLLEFGAGAGRKTLRIDAADRPASGTTFSTTLIDFDSSSATYVDLAGLAFTSGATATLSGTTLTLKDGAYTARFTLAGEAANKYSVFSDGAGGTEFRAAVGSTQTPLLVHAIATFASNTAAHPTSPASGGAMSSTFLAAHPDGLRRSLA